MVVVKVELWRQGNPEDVVNLATVHIANVGGTRTKGNYECRFFGRHGRRIPARDVLHFGFARLSKPALSLVRRVLEQAGY
jgi:hypothetical protein